MQLCKSSCGIKQCCSSVKLIKLLSHKDEGVSPRFLVFFYHLCFLSIFLNVNQKSLLSVPIATSVNIDSPFLYAIQI